MKKIVVVLIFIFGGIYIYNQTQLITDVVPESSNTVTVDTEKTEELLPEDEINQLVVTATVSGQTALDLLSANTDIETKDYGDAGQFVVGVNNLKGDNENYWAFYINDEFAQKGVSQTILEEGDVVKIVYEKINKAEF